MTDHKHEFDGFAYGESYEYDITDTPLYGSDDSASYIPDDNDDTSFYELDDADAYDADLDDVDLDDADLDDVDSDNADSDNADSDNADLDNADVDDVDLDDADLDDVDSDNADSDGADNCSVKNIIYTTEFPAVSLDDLSEPDVTSLTGIDPGIDEDMKRYNITSIVKIAAVAVSAVVLLIFGTISWFTMGREVENSGLQMTAGDMPFEIAATGTQGVRHLSEIASLAPGYKVGTIYTHDDTDYYVTDGSTESLRLRYTAGESEIGPGGSGVCDLYIKSKIDGDLSVKITMNVTPYAAAYVYDLDDNGNRIPVTNENDAPVYEEDGETPVYRTTETIMPVSDITTAKCNISPEDLASLQSAASYIKGHIMFFDATSPANAAYTYTGALTNRTKIFEKENAVSGEVYPVPIYWMWPNTLGQIALQTNSGDLRSGTPVVQETSVNLSDDIVTDKELVLAYLWSNKNYIFADTTSITEQMIYAADTSTNFDTLSAQYNAADYAIGTKIAYFLIELTVSENTAE